MSSVTAGVAASMQSIGRLIGCLTLPALTSKIRRKNGVFAFLSLAGVLLTILITIIPAGVGCYIVILLTGICLGGILPLYMSLPVQLPQISESMTGTAGGAIATFELLGAVLVPSYIISPIAGGNTNLLFILGSVFASFGFVLSFFICRVKKS